MALYAWKDDTNGQRKNLHFLRVQSDDKKAQKLAFTIETADLYMGNRDDYIYFLRDRNIIYFKWGA